jgi:hypothetical protein
VLLAARPGLGGHILWRQTDPSLTWLPFFRMRSLHLGQVPISLSSSDGFADTMALREGLYTSREAP